MIWLWSGVAILGAIALGLLGIHWHIFARYVPICVRIFQEKPLFILPFGKLLAGAEEVTLTTPDGVSLNGCYLRTEKARKGVILFGLEFGSNRWACQPYCEFLRAEGYDIFALELRGQGNSPAPPDYEPLQWVTDYEVVDLETALAYLKTRADRPPGGVGFFGLSKGGGAGLMAAARDPFIRCCVTDGAFATMTTIVPYMKQWILIYSPLPWAAKLIPTWYYRYAGRVALRRVERLRKCHYPNLEAALPKIAARPLLMIHGGADNYIKPDMARALFECAAEPRELWMVDKAKHNQAMHVANGEYRRRVLEFFDRHLAGPGCGSTNPQPVAAAQRP